MWRIMERWEYRLQVKRWQENGAGNGRKMRPTSHLVYKMGWEGLLALRPTHPKKNLDLKLAERKSSLNKRPFLGPTQRPPPSYVLIP